MSATVGLSVASSTSQKTGRAPRAAIAWAAATKLTVGSTTSSPGPRPSSSTAMNVADEHEFVAVTCSRATPRWRAKAASNSAVRAPRPTQLVFESNWVGRGAGAAADPVAREDLSYRGELTPAQRRLHNTDSMVHPHSPPA